ncbi:transcriptional regulator [Amycolatopsis sp. WAC 01375]|uniref:PucR family transcriptional regulator n=1 Tax=unclassified Amycolatopsis TaxID=2618356 RepID=UPI000F787A4F|nr:MULTISPECIES: helix-turn-helix domain-containing protein [unclassified Amycolatopsis]RSM75645.1 transcriptional regulator [Amycolatopsis sp. WAC 01375]RSN26113.1 transcriptional regulator [Amycolatopsis sp. WAC 01416]
MTRPQDARSGVEATYGPLLTPARPGGSSGRPVQLWALLPRELATVFRPVLADVAGEVVREIQRTIPDYARPLDGAFGKALKTGVQMAFLQFVERIGNPEAPSEDRRSVFLSLGVQEFQQGRNVDVLQAAYRVGARVTWRRVAEAGRRAGVPSATLCLLAEAIFAYIDELSALSVEGHAEAREKAAGALERRRHRLMELLLAEPPSPPDVIKHAADLARWQLPELLVAVALEQSPDETPAIASTALADFETTSPCLLLPAPEPDDRERFAEELAGRRAAVGPAVPPAFAARSLRAAREALRLVDSGALLDEPVTWCVDHLSRLWLLKEPFLAAELVRERLGPLTGLTGKQHSRLAGTLLAWLETCGNVREVAERLAVHPQTVRSRAQELETLFADGLRDPERRFEMILALRAAPS